MPQSVALCNPRNSSCTTRTAEGACHVLEAGSAVRQAQDALLFVCRMASFVAVRATISSLFFRLAESLMKRHFSITFSHLSLTLSVPLCQFLLGLHFHFSFFFLLSRLSISFRSIAYFT